MRSPGDFDGLDSPGSWFLRPKVCPTSHRALKQQQQQQKLRRGGRCRRIVYDPRGTQELCHNWRLGTATNNQAEAYALLQGIKTVNPSIVKSIITIGDSSIIIHFMNNDKDMNDDKLAKLILVIKKNRSFQFEYI